MTGTRTQTGGLIDRNAKRHFTFDGKSFTGFAGDTLASALLANGVRVVGRSFKYHRPRGVWGAWVDDPNAIMDVRLKGRRFPNCQATTTPLEHGMDLRAVNAWPSAQWDIKGGLDLFHRWLGAGFYYKTFMWPDWHLFEPMIRKMAGLGTVSDEVWPEYLSDQITRNCDLLVVGGGPAGLVAARAAAEAGQDVLVVDDHPRMGGSAFQSATIDGKPATDWVDDQLAALKAAGALVLRNTTAFGVYDHGMVGLSETAEFGIAPRLWRVRPRRMILATGALDRPVTFAGNDRPGILSLSAAGDYLARYGVRVGKNICVLAGHSLAEHTGAALEAAGARVSYIDPAQGYVAATGRGKLTGLQQGGVQHRADTVLTSAGLTPLVHLWRHAGGKLDWRDDLQAFVPGAGPAHIAVVGAANGEFDLETACTDARAVALGHARPTPTTLHRFTALWPDPAQKGRQWIDFQHDVTLKDIAQAADENYVSVEHLKRYTTLGMASDQGKTSNMAGLAAMATLQGRRIPEVGTTTFRPPFVPVPLALYRGHHSGTDLHPLKRLPLERAHRTADAALGEYGGWLRPAWYGAGDPDQHIADETRRARSNVGVFDASPLGKIEVMGPDAEAFLNFIYYNTVATLKPGALRYGFMLTEAGTIYDDGVLARLGPDHFSVSCSSSHATGVLHLLETWRQDGHDPDRVFIHDATAQWATLTVTGPKARAVLKAVDFGIDLSAEAFAHMHIRSGTFQGHPARLARVSFTGDLSFEISVPASVARALWDILMPEVTAQGGAPLGLEAVFILRAEKGYIIVGRDTDGMTMPHDLGFAGPRLKKKTAFVGDRSLHMPEAVREGRRQLVGLRVAPGSKPLPTGAHLVSGGTDRRSIGIVTSSYNSSTLGYPIALALLEGGQARHGQEVDVYHLGAPLRATVCPACFHDPEGVNLHA